MPHIVNKINDRLAEWKGQCLSMAGLVVLAKSVIKALPIYATQVITITAIALVEIEKIPKGIHTGS